MIEVRSMEEIDDYGRPIPEHPLLAGRVGPVIPPMPAVARSGKWPAFLRDFLRANPTCFGCGRPAETGHHAIPVGVDPSLELDEDNVAPVCVPCHFVVAHGGRWDTYDPDVFRQLRLHYFQVAHARPIRTQELT